MKRFLAIAGLCFGLALFASAPDVKAQQIIPNVTKIYSTTVSGDAITLEDASKNSVSFKKGTFYTKVTGNTTGAQLEIRDITSGKTVFKGPVSGITMTGYATDTLKVVYIRQYFNN